MARSTSWPASALVSVTAATVCPFRLTRRCDRSWMSEGEYVMRRCSVPPVTSWSLRMPKLSAPVAATPWSDMAPPTPSSVKVVRTSRADVSRAGGGGAAAALTPGSAIRRRAATTPLQCSFPVFMGPTGLHTQNRSRAKGLSQLGRAVVVAPRINSKNCYVQHVCRQAPPDNAARMLNPNETMRLRRPPMLTPPGRPLQVGWAQEFGRWLWHLFVLPPGRARPWPRWTRWLVRPVLLRLAAGLGVRNVRSMRAWALHLLLIEPPEGSWSHPEKYMRPRPVASLGALLHHPIAPRVAPLLYGMAARIESYSATLARWYSEASRSTRWAVGMLVLALFGLIASTPLDPVPQLALLTVMWLLSLLVRQLPGYGPGLLLVTFSIIASARYIWWRCTHTMDLNGGAEMFFGMGLLAAECYTWLIMLLGYAQNSRPLRRKSVPLPRDRSLWPSVDVYVPTYNEPLEVVRPTVLAALNLDWPADRLRVYILDDGRRPAFREFAAQCGAEYVIRGNNAHAKAGNLNHALTITRGEFVAIFD